MQDLHLANIIDGISEKIEVLVKHGVDIISGKEIPNYKKVI